MKLVIKVPDDFGKLAKCKPVLLCFGNYIMAVRSYVGFPNNEDLNLKDIDFIEESHDMREFPFMDILPVFLQTEDPVCKKCVSYPNNDMCILCKNPDNKFSHLYYKEKEDSDE